MVEIDHSLGEHVMLFVLSPPPKVHECSFYQRSSQFLDLGRLYLVPANTAYRGHQGGGQYRCLAVTFDQEWFKRLAGSAEAWDLSRCFDIKSDRIKHSLLRLTEEMTSPGLASDILIEGMGLSVAADLAKYLGCPNEPQQGRAGVLSTKQFSQITDYLNSIDGISPTISDLSELIGVSRRYFTGAFKKATGETPHQFISRVRMQKAMELLRSTNLPIKVIAYKVGFTSQGNFSAAFYAACARTPTAYRAEFRSSFSNPMNHFKDSANRSRSGFDAAPGRVGKGDKSGSSYALFADAKLRDFFQ
jgi:AraC family transcriptional regulator